MASRNLHRRPSCASCTSDIVDMSGAPQAKLTFEFLIPSDMLQLYLSVNMGWYRLDHDPVQQKNG